MSSQNVCIRVGNTGKVGFAVGCCLGFHFNLPSNRHKKEEILSANIQTSHMYIPVADSKESQPSPGFSKFFFGF